jgi:hypothetical protein
MNCQNKAEILVKALENNYQNQLPARFNQAAMIKSI